MSLPAFDVSPPGETGRELTGADAFAALHDALVDITAEPKLRLTLSDIQVRRTGRWVVLTVRYRKRPENEVTIRISRAWAQVLIGRLTQALER